MLRNRLFPLFGIALAVALAAGAAIAEEKRKPIETFTAFAANMQRGSSAVIDIAIYRWSTDEERESLLTTLQEFGRDKMIDALMKIRPTVGYMRTPNSLGYDLYYARNNPTPDGGRKVVIATNRRVHFHEAAQSRRSMDYQLTLIEIQLDKDGNGVGKMVPAAKVTWDAKTKTIEVENFQALPVDLINVKAKTP
jgi:hypothetical protein